MKAFFRNKFMWLGLVALLAGCATIISGTTGDITISSSPSGASVYVSGQYYGKTPVQVNLSRSHEYTVLVKKKGYTHATASIQREFNALSILNLVLIPLWMVDVITGALWEFDKDAIHVTLDRRASSINPSQKRIVVGENMTAVPYKGKTALLWKTTAH